MTTVAFSPARNCRVGESALILQERTLSTTADYPDTRYPDTSEVDEQIRGRHVDPETKVYLPDQRTVEPLDYTGGAHQALEDFLNSPDPDMSVVFRPRVMTFAPGPFTSVSDVYFNCTSSPASHTVTWSQTESSTMNFSIALKAGVKLWDVVTAEVSASFGMSWTTSETFSDSFQMTLQPGELGWLERAPVLQTVVGETWLLMGTPSQSQSRALWGPSTYTGAATDGRPSGSLVAKARQMTEAEKSQFCRGNPSEPAVIPAPVAAFLTPLTTKVIGYR